MRAKLRAKHLGKVYVEKVTDTTSTNSRSQALQWFEAHANQEVTWTELSELQLVNQAKGIHKPAGARYAVSIRQTLESTYQDSMIHHYPDGRWSYQYFQKGENGTSDDKRFTNQALANCLKDKVPVGVLIQTQKKPKTTKYRVEGIAFIVGWENGYFLLRSNTNEHHLDVIEVQLQRPSVQKEIEKLIHNVSSQPFNPNSILDDRKKTITAIHQRQGQGTFRDKLIAVYQKCVVTGYQLTQVLEAAHIYPYQSTETNHISNGLLLRSDIHTLFDQALIAVDTATMTIIVSPQLSGTEYKRFANQPLFLPKDERLHPNKEALDIHRKIANL